MIQEEFSSCLTLVFSTAFSVTWQTAILVYSSKRRFFCIKIDLNSQRTGLVHQYVLEYQHGRRDVTWKRSVLSTLALRTPCYYGHSLLPTKFRSPTIEVWLKMALGITDSCRDSGHKTTSRRRPTYSGLTVVGKSRDKERPALALNHFFRSNRSGRLRALRPTCSQVFIKSL